MERQVDITITHHAKQRMEERGITEEQIFEAILKGNSSVKLYDGKINKVYCYGKLKVILDKDCSSVVTVANKQIKPKISKQKPNRSKRNRRSRTYE